MSWTTVFPVSIVASQNASFHQHYNDSGNETTHKEIPYTPYNERLETYIVPIIFFLILVIGITGNGILVLTILRHAKMRNVPNTYVLSLALGDLLASIFTVTNTVPTF